MKPAAILVMFGIAACGGGGGDDAAIDQEAESTFYAESGLVTTLQQEAIAGSPVAVAAAPRPINYSGACPDGGTFTMTGAFDDAGIDYQADATLVGCMQGAERFDGTTHWIAVQTGTVLTQTINDTIDYEGPTYAAAFVYELTIVYDSAGPTYTIAGRYRFGGTWYTVTDWAGAGF